MRFIDFFAGIGGFRRGMELAGHKCVGFCEYDKFATASYTAMHLITDEQYEYLKTMDMQNRRKEILNEKYRNGEWYAKDICAVRGDGVPEAECWCFGAPCQSFSIAGKRAGLNGESGLIREIFRLLREKGEENRPEWIIYENVKGMFSSNKGFDYLAILSEMDELGYDVQWQLFNSKDWGVPQNRERVYTLGHLRTKGPRKIFPVEREDGQIGIPGSSVKIHVICNTKPETAKRIGYREDVWGAKGCAGCLTATDYKQPRQVAIPVKEAVKKGYSEAHLGDSINFSYPNSALRRGRIGKQEAHTLDTSCSQGIFVPVDEDLSIYARWYENYKSYIAIRRLTPKECFRLQGWSDEYYERAAFVNSDSQLYKQAGNGVTVNVVEVIGRALIE